MIVTVTARLSWPVPANHVLIQGGLDFYRQECGWHAPFSFSYSSAMMSLQAQCIHRKCTLWTGYQFLHFVLALAAKGTSQVSCSVVTLSRHGMPPNSSLPWQLGKSASICSP
jgi:hypothetical protein